VHSKPDFVAKDIFETKYKYISLNMRVNGNKKRQSERQPLSMTLKPRALLTIINSHTPLIVRCMLFLSDIDETQGREGNQQIHASLEGKVNFN